MYWSRKLLGSAGSTVLLTTLVLRADLPAYDGFDNGPRANLHGSDGGVGWTGPWQDIGSSLATGVQLPGIEYPNLRSSPGAAVTPPGASYAERTDYYRAFGPHEAGSKLYIAFLYRPETGYATFGGLTIENWPTQLLIGVPLGYYVYGLQYGEYGLALSNIPEVENEVAFLVLEIENDQALQKTVYRLFVDPPGGGARPPYPDADLVRALRPLPTAIRLTNDGGVRTDEIRVGATWESVNPPPCPADLDGDGAIGQGDLGILLSNFGAPGGGTPEQGDLDGDGDVDQGDLGVLLAAYGAPC